MRYNKNNCENLFRKYLPRIICALFWISIILFIAAISSLIASFCINEELHDCKIGNVWLDYKFWTETFGGCLTLWVIIYNLKKFIDIETVKALGDLRTKLNDDRKKEIHTFLFPNEDKTPILNNIENKSNSSDAAAQFANADIFDYIGTIELGAIMLKRDAITLDEFKNQFGYRVENIKNNSNLMRHIKENKEYYSDFLWILAELNDGKY